jgi:UDP:flavonoid glycosyltransferase YjiC (YdhE family)
MKVLFTTQPQYGHWHPLVPFARAVMDAGHDVAFATAPGFCPTVEATGFRCFPVGKDETEAEKKARLTRLGQKPGTERGATMWSDYFAGVWARETLVDLLPLAREWQPDLIVREDVEFAGCVTAECLGIPHAVVQVSSFRPYLFKSTGPAFSRLRGDAGLPPDPNCEMLHRYLHIYPTPLSFHNPEYSLPPTSHSVFHGGFDSSSGKELPEWVSDLPPFPTVYATLGTVMNHNVDILAAILEGLRGEDLNLIMTTGVDVDPSIFDAPKMGTGEGQTHIERYIPQSLILPYCDLMIVHGGSGTVKDSFRHGLPMVIIPIAADQYVNAARCADLGIARVIAPEERTPEAIREAAMEVLQNPTYRQNAEKIRDEVRAMPGLDEAVRLFEQLARERKPILSSNALSKA